MKLSQTHAQTLKQLVDNVVELTSVNLRDISGTSNGELALINLRKSAAELHQSLDKDSQIVLEAIDGFEGGLQAAYVVAVSSNLGVGGVRSRNTPISEQELKETLERLDDIRDAYHKEG